MFSYLKFWAAGYLKRVNPEIIAITGSVGKTTTKEAIFEVLKIKFGKNVRKSEGNLNNETGAPVAVLGFKAAPSYEAKNPFGWFPIITLAPFRSFFLKPIKILVLEFAADKPGDIEHLTSFIKPKIGVLTAIGPAHIEFFGKLEKIIEEKTDLLRALPVSTSQGGPTDGWAILNLDDDNVRKVSYGGRWQKKTYAIENQADIRAKDIKTEIKNFCAKSYFKIKYDNKEIKIEQKTLGTKANVLASLAATAVGLLYEMKAAEIVKGLENVKPEKHRLNVLAGKKGTTIIDDAYNANPLSMEASLELLNNLPIKRPSKKIAVLGDMLEIGKYSLDAHKEVGALAQKAADIVVAVGKADAKKYHSQKYFSSIHKASQYLLNKIGRGDIVLIKASRGIGLEKLVEEIRENG